MVPTILIVGVSSVFDDGLRELLVEAGCAPVAQLHSGNEAALIQQIIAAQPTVVLLNETALLDPVQFAITLLMQPALVTLRVLGLRPDDNTIWQYSKHQHLIERTDQLLSLLQHTF